MTMIRKLLNACTAPARSITLPVDRRNMRLLSGVLLLISTIALAAVCLAQLPFTPPPRLAPSFTIALFVVLGIAYGLSRTRYARVAVTFSIALFLLAPLAIALIGIRPPEVEILNFLLVPLLVNEGVTEMRDRLSRGSGNSAIELTIRWSPVDLRNRQTSEGRPEASRLGNRG